LNQDHRHAAWPPRPQHHRARRDIVISPVSWPSARSSTRYLRPTRWPWILRDGGPARRGREFVAFITRALVRGW